MMIGYVPKKRTYITKVRKITNIASAKGGLNPARSTLTYGIETPISTGLLLIG